MKLRRVPAPAWQWKRDTGEENAVLASVSEILASVRRSGDEAVRGYTEQFDGYAGFEAGWDLRVAPQELERAWLSLSAELQGALETAAHRIRCFHQAQQTPDILYEGHDGERLGLTWRAIRRVGVYAPGGKAPYPSTVLMDVIPAQVAGVGEIALVSPPQRDTGLPHPFVLAAAYLVGVTEVYRLGGAQAIAALAYGTQTVQAVDKVVGPGNIFVATAKRLVSGTVGIDSIAGPSEVFIVADAAANPDFVAADMLAQAEHDEQAGAVCVVPSAAFADKVEASLERQLEKLSRRETCQRALEQWGAAVIAENLSEAIDVVNASAPEHLELLVANPDKWLPRVQTAGAVFLGPYAPEPVGDYYAGTNHVLPTHGTARFASGLGVHDFMRRMSYVSYKAETLAKHSEHIVTLANAEGLTAHANAVQIRGNVISAVRRDGSGANG